MGFNYKKNRAWAENLQIVTQIGLTMAGCIGFCFYIGYTLDKWLGTRGLFISVFILLGVAGGANVVYRQIMKVTQPNGAEEEGQNDGND
jgi:ATP synthase protein I